MEINKIKKSDTIAEENPQKEKKKRKRRKTGHKILIVLLVLAIAVVSCVLAGAIYIIASAPDFDTDKLFDKESTVLVYNNDVEFARLGNENRDLVTYDELPQVLVDAIVATEDSRFFQHDGFDIARFLMATFGQITGVSGAGGASTLTMQVVKNTYTSKESSGIDGIIRKFTDIYMSIFKVEKQYTKEEIIEFYVNAPWLGNGTYGVEQASQTYFGKSVRDLSLPEAALIAGIFNAPAVQNPFYSTENATARRNRVLDLMELHGYITAEQKEDAKSISVESTIVDQASATLNPYQSFIDTVVNEVIEDTGLDPYVVPMRIQTTISPEIQDVLNDLNAEKLGYTFPNDKIQVAIVVTDVNNGAILAVDGRRNQKGERVLNLATGESRFQPGSTAKPIFAYGPLIEYNNASTGTYFFDDPYTYSNGTPFYDADRQYQGRQTMRVALSQSRNIPAVQAFQQVDLNNIANFVHALGIDYGENLYESYAIGGGIEVNPLQMAAAYGAFARGGYYIEPYSYTKITFKDTNEELEQKPKREKVMSEETAYMINSMLMTAQKNYVGGNFSISGTDVGAKTGTSTYDPAVLRQYGIPTSASADNWNITYSPDYVISLWYGYEKLISKDYYTDPIKAAIARKNIMTAIARKIYKKNSRFSVPSGIAKIEVEKETVPLQLPSAYTPADMRMTELFKVGTEPSEESNRYQQLENPTNGSATILDNSINISWDPIATPAAIDENELQTYFTENYDKAFAKKYYEKRIKYNNESIGSVGYNVYLSKNGKETFLGYTNKTSYTYNDVSLSGNYKFIVRSSYSIFKDNMSSGLEISVTSSNVDPNTPDDDYRIGSVVLKGSANETLKSTLEATGGAYYNDPGLTVKDINGNVITSKVSITKTIIDKDTNTEVNGIDLTKTGSYTITYSVDGYDKELTRNVTVQ